VHRTSDRFWQCYHALPRAVQERADRAFAHLRDNRRHPSVRLKKVGLFWSARIGRNYRALAVEEGDDLIWVWLGSHADYDRIVRGG